ncbi:MAG: hypothetical protein F6K58_23460 [Symploca sp. SIO2E9]|nr:hypothetical protein [Symploca sp. SIO2E9]
MNEKNSGGTSKQTPRRGDAETRRNQMPPKISFTRYKDPYTLNATSSLRTICDRYSLEVMAFGAAS